MSMKQEDGDLILRGEDEVVNDDYLTYQFDIPSNETTPLSGVTMSESEYSDGKEDTPDRERQTTKLLRSMFNDPTTLVLHAEELIFKPSEDVLGSKTASIGIQANCKGKIGFKIKSTAPEKFVASPSHGNINHKCKATVEIMLKDGHEIEANDCFLITLTHIKTWMVETMSENVISLLSRRHPGKSILSCREAVPTKTDIVKVPVIQTVKRTVILPPDPRPSQMPSILTAQEDIKMKLAWSQHVFEMQLMAFITMVFVLMTSLVLLYTGHIVVDFGSSEYEQKNIVELLGDTEIRIPLPLYWD